MRSLYNKSKESLLYKLLFRVSKGGYILWYAISPLSVILHSTHSLLSKLMCFTCFSILKIVGLRVKLVWNLVFDDKSTWFCLFLYRTCTLYLAFLYCRERKRSKERSSAKERSPHRSHRRHSSHRKSESPEKKKS